MKKVRELPTIYNDLGVKMHNIVEEYKSNIDRLYKNTFFFYVRRFT